MISCDDIHNGSIDGETNKYGGTHTNLLFLIFSGCSLRLHVFAIKVKSGACYITGQWGQVQNKRNLTLTRFGVVHLLFFIVKFYLNHDFID